jgi:hypothetical protein
MIKFIFQWLAYVAFHTLIQFNKNTINKNINGYEKLIKNGIQNDIKQ